MWISPLCFGMPGGMEWILILLVVLLFFGAKKIPELARGLGKGIKEFKDASKGENKEEDDKGADSDKNKDSGKKE